MFQIDEANESLFRLSDLQSFGREWICSLIRQLKSEISTLLVKLNGSHVDMTNIHWKFVHDGFGNVVVHENEQAMLTVMRRIMSVPQQGELQVNERALQSWRAQLDRLAACLTL